MVILFAVVTRTKESGRVVGDKRKLTNGALVPKRSQVDNLLVPVRVSSSHIAFGSIRMEPVFMILGQSAATAAAMAIDAGIAVQDVLYAKLRGRLIQDGQVLESREAGTR
jgi:FAD dependent oxidoreductase